FGIEWKIAAERQEERAKITIHRMTWDWLTMGECHAQSMDKADPSLGSCAVRSGTPASSPEPCLRTPPPRPYRTWTDAHHSVFALGLAELQRRDEAAGDRAHQRCGWERPAMFAKEM